MIHRLVYHIYGSKSFKKNKGGAPYFNVSWSQFHYESPLSVCKYSQSRSWSGGFVFSRFININIL